MADDSSNTQPTPDRQPPSAEKKHNPLTDRVSAVCKRMRHRWMRFLALFDNLRGSLRTRHRLVIMDSQTYKERLAFQLSPLNLFITVGVATIVLIIFNTLLIAFTPLREFIPGYANSDLIERSYHNAAAVDSLEARLRAQEWMIATMQEVINGEAAPTTEEAHHHSDSLSAIGVSVDDYQHSQADSMLRLYVEQNDSRYEVRTTNRHQQTSTDNVVVATQLFFSPIKGQIIDTFNTRLRHYGVDVAGITNSPISAAANGTVLFANFTSETGYVIALQHSANVITVYKHCSALLRQEGDVVLAGEPLGYLGNSGSLSSGPHLHFELWIAGKPVNPTQYVIF